MTQSTRDPRIPPGIAAWTAADQTPDTFEVRLPGRRVLGFLAVAVLCGGIGALLVHLPPLLVVAAVLSFSFVTFVLMQPFFGLLVYTIIFMLRPGELYPVLIPLHLEKLMGVLALASIFLEQHRQEGHLRLDDSKQTRLFLLFIVGVALSVPFAVWRGQAVEGLVDTLKIACFYFMVVQSVTTRRRSRWFVLILALSTLYIAGTSMKAYLSGEYVFRQGIERAVGITSAGGDANNLGATMASALPLFILLTFDRSIGWLRLVTGAGAALLLSTQIITGSRSSLLALLAGLGWLWWKSKHRLVLLILGLTVAVAVGTLVPEQYKQRYGTVTKSSLDASSEGRLDAWGVGLHMFVDHPLVGVGIRCFGTAHALNYSPEGEANWLQAHSLYVQILAELGLAGSLAFFAFLVHMMRANRKTIADLAAERPQWQFERRVLVALGTGFVVLLVSGIFGHNLLRETWYVYGALSLAIQRQHLDSPPEPVAT